MTNPKAGGRMQSPEAGLTFQPLSASAAATPTKQPELKAPPLLLRDNFT